MPWICEYCSTDNEDKERECFVCGARRSMRAIRRAKKEARRRRALSFAFSLAKWMRIVATVLLITSATLLAVAAICLLAKQMMSDNPSALPVVLFGVLKHAWEHFTVVLLRNVPEMVRAFAHSTLIQALGGCVAVLRELLTRLLTQIDSWLSLVFGERVSLHWEELKNAISSIVLRMIQSVTNLKNSLSAAQ